MKTCYFSYGMESQDGKFLEYIADCESKEVFIPADQEFSYHFCPFCGGRVLYEELRPDE